MCLAIQSHKKCLLTPKKQKCSKSFLLSGNSLDKNFLIEAKSVVNVALGTSMGNVKQDFLSEACYILNKKITVEKQRPASEKNDRNKGFDTYNWHPRLIKSFKMFTSSLFLHLPELCLEIDFQPLKQVSLVFLEKPGKASRRFFWLSLHQFSVAYGQIA